MGEGDVPILVDQTLDLGSRSELLVLLAGEPGGVSVVAATPGAVEQALVVQAVHDRHIGCVSAGGLGLPVQRLHDQLDRRVPLPPDLPHYLCLQLMQSGRRSGGGGPWHRRGDYRGRRRRGVLGVLRGPAPGCGRMWAVWRTTVAGSCCKATTNVVLRSLRPADDKLPFLRNDRRA